MLSQGKITIAGTYCRIEYEEDWLSCKELELEIRELTKVLEKMQKIDQALAPSIAPIDLSNDDIPF